MRIPESLLAYRDAMSDPGPDYMGLHCPMPVTIDGNGPAQSDGELHPDFHHWACWCPDAERCPVIFDGAWKALSEVITA